jgi:ubiquinone/menaquinone biosynthesis C-methylase UbiE
MIAKLFISIVRFSPRFQRAMWKWWYQRLAKRATDSGWTFMNYGYISLNDKSSIDLKPEDESNRLFIQLYDYASSQIPLENKKVLEVGSGRGGGASFIARYYNPKLMTGLDYSPSAIELSNKIHNNVSNLKFVKGDAENLPFDDNTFDAVINVESSHCYGNMKSFLNEVCRVLKKGGHFSWVDLRGKDMIKDTESAFNELDIKCIHEQSITLEVLEGLDGIHERKMEMIKLHVPKFLQPAFKDFSGVKNSKIYNAFNDGSAVYLAKAFQKS